MDCFLKILSLNIGMSHTLAGLPALLAHNMVDIALLQEVTLTEEQLGAKLQGLGYQVRVNIDHTSPSSPGTAVAWKESVPVKEVLNIVLCRLQIIVLSPYIVVNAYAPSGSTKRAERSIFFRQDVFRALSLFPQSVYILSGDFNCILSPRDVENGTGFNQKFCKDLKDLVFSFNLVDVFRKKFPDKEEFTFFRAGKSSSRLDRFYIPSTYAEDFQIDHLASLSDHCAVLLTFKIIINYGAGTPSSIKRSSYWKLNVSILRDSDFLPTFKSCWDNLKKSQESWSDKADWWDGEAKPAIKSFCITFSKQRRAMRKDKVMFLLSYLKIVLNHKNWDEVARVREELKMMFLEDSMGFIVRSRHKQNAEEEAASLYHAAKEVRSDKNNIKALKINGIIEKNVSIIEQTITSFFEALFNGFHNRDLVNIGSSFMPDYSHLDEFLNNIGVMSDHESVELEEKIQMEELKLILKECSSNRSPGLDGLPYEFYVAVWDIIGEEFKDVLQCQLDRNSIVESNKIGATRLVSKISGVPSTEELRPITLLNVDYKILSKLLVLRIKPKLPKIILSSQLCTVNGKNILFGVNNVISSILYVNAKKKKACLLSLDFFKAYDRVLIGYLVKVMERMNFSTKFCEWIKMLHVGARTCFILQHLTELIPVTFSIRQGDPIAMILYIIYVEPLLLYLERNLHGLSIRQPSLGQTGLACNQVLEAFCDDVNILTDNCADLVKVDEAIRKFEDMSGAILSRNFKCKILGLGGWKGRKDWPLTYVRTEEEIKIFGVYIRNSYRAMLRSNWDFRFNKFSNTVKSWSARNLPTLGAKVEVLKTFALSRVYYIASILPIPKTMIKKFESVMGKFIWSSSGWLLGVSLDEIKNSFSRGGLEMVCLHSMCKSLLLSQFLRLLKGDYCKSVSHVGYWLGDMLEDLLPGIFVDSVSKNIPEYYAEIESLIMEARFDDLVTVAGWKLITNKMLYKSKINNLDPPKVEVEAGVSLTRVWLFIRSAVLESESREICYLLLHNKLPVRERLCRIGIRNDPYCDICPGSVVSDAEHFFCSCGRVNVVWKRIKEIVSSLAGRNVEDRDLIRFNLPKCASEMEIVWIMGNYFDMTWKIIHTQGKARLKLEEFFGFLRFKYKKDQQGARPLLNHIPGIF